MRRVATAGAVITVVIAGTAPSAIADQTVSKAAYVHRADALCKAGYRKIDAVTKPTQADEVPKYLQQAMAATTPFARRIEALPLPSSGTSTARTLRKLQVKELAFFRKTTSALNAPNANTAAILKQFVDYAGPEGTRENALWRKLGSKICSQDH